MSVVPGVKSTRRLNSVSDEASNVTAVVYWTTSKPSGLASVHTTSGLAASGAALPRMSAAKAAWSGSDFMSTPCKH
ncbi:hypothetical protein D3C76_402390 [compost metagenome]